MAETTLSQQRLRYQQSLRDALERIVGELSSMPDVEQVILFGSYAQGREDLLTDLDLLVVMASDDDFVTRTAKLYQRLHPGVDLDLLVYTPTEFEVVRQGGFIGHATATGKVLYAKKRA